MNEFQAAEGREKTGPESVPDEVAAYERMIEPYAGILQGMD